MAQPAAFSRLQLAAALLEYDNDLTNPDAPNNRSAHTSAIFAPLRRTRPTLASRKSDYLGVALPSDTGSLNPRESTVQDPRLSRNSIQTFGKNPFGKDEEEEEAYDEEAEPIPEVDLASWGLDAFIPKEKPEKKRKVKSSFLPNPHDAPSLRSERALPLASRRMSLGNFDQFGVGGAFLDDQPSRDSDSRRRSVGTPMDNPIPQEPRRASFHALVDNIPAASPLHSIPFPSTSPRSQSPAADYRTIPQERPRVLSSASIATGISQQLNDNPFALEPPEHSRASRFDPKAIAHTRTMSNVSMGSRLLNDAASVLTAGEQRNRERRLSTLELMRPKVLVMPSPLQGTTLPTATQPFRDGFHLSTDGPPLPSAARASRRSSAALPAVESTLTPTVAPVASNSFTPNPRLNLSLSQLTFRQLAHMGGERDVAYSDIDTAHRRATEDGEQVQEEPEPEPDIMEDAPIDTVLAEDPAMRGRPAGKLFGKSLIDDLEARKAQMRNKQRVFTGDQRPTMMDRQRSSTFIDPASLQTRPVSHLDPQTGLSRGNSTSVKPLLTFDSEIQIQTPKISPGLPHNKSVFGTDKLWEREMVKLREIEAQEKLQTEKQKLIEAAQETRKSQKKNKKDKRAKTKRDEAPAAPEVITELGPIERVSAEPPTLPVIQKAIRGPPPPRNDEDDEDSVSEDSEPEPNAGGVSKGWYAGSSDGSEGKRVPRAIPRIVARKILEDDNSEDDLPLVTTIHRQKSATLQRRDQPPESDDERPLSTFLLRKPEGTTPSDDDEPLGLRVSRVLSVADDDDRPLALHPEQQRRSQYIMAQQQQHHQQQQMLMQAAQMQNSMYFNAGSGFFAPPMMMQPPMMAPSPPPSHDAGKFGLVDKWRRDISGSDT